MTAFAVRDRTLGGGYLTLNGAHQTDGAVFDEIPISQIGQWAFVAGPSGASDTIGFNAYDGHGMYNIATAATVTAQSASPVDSQPLGVYPISGLSEIVQGNQSDHNDDIVNDHLYQTPEQWAYDLQFRRSPFIP